ncbi:YutD family protein [Streptococcus sp. DD12]|uniref:YutD family protein n=1 Tax=Streptococcus sp. DD12 TaxID=1777880 RepID=UPI00079968F7|nr:YutD-like domain-containing protein [Streptococcus sp. DD12]KXT76438.1 hypothetical protein STRDD12_00517 [Streptococcus sp. DD12]
MKKDISPDLYNYNRFPGPIFQYEAPFVQAEGRQFELVYNSQEGFDTESFTQRYSDWLCQYDFIVGDWGNDQLRLKGFYETSKKGENTISRLEDYLQEYCNFGCDYFVLKNTQPQKVTYQEEKDYRRKDRRSRKKSSQGAHFQTKRRSQETRPAQKPSKKRESNQHFTIRKKG